MVLRFIPTLSVEQLDERQRCDPLRYSMAHIAILEPSPAMARLFELVITQLGHQAVPITGPADLPAACDLLLADLGTEPGLAAVRSLRAERPDVPIVCTSIYSLTPEVAALAPDAYLLKPFHLADLTDALNRALAKTSAEED